MSMSSNLTASWEAALQKLIEGNNRFTSGKPADKELGAGRREELLKGQNPFAVIVSCSDSRIPPELLFDQALGDIFVVRTAGNVVDTIAIGSVEYAVEHLHTPLVVVMGHENCGAVKAAVDGGEAEGSIGAIIDKIEPSLARAKAAGATGAQLYEAAADENIMATIRDLQKSPIIQRLLASGNLTLAGAKYHLGSGEVVFNISK
ncbi:Carbonic anhydrase [Pelotomaculum schinkii]|uniref:Carbonic anhydrase n=2 Tax=Desulfotomaculaceae TaxID=2937910 RepID=A0A4Y7R4Z5_9FIRM|nr:Carbonic anhydrase [Pelotomaculum schinkii]TEB11884.1 Carbonic anhydrase [Pelotomaculum sp. FP]